MREVYRGNGFVITTNDCGEIFVTNENGVQLRMGSDHGDMTISYLNSSVCMEPHSIRKLVFFNKHR